MKDQLVTSLQGALRPDEINCGIKVILKKRKRKNTSPVIYSVVYLFFEKAEDVEIVVLKCFLLNETHYKQNISSNKRST